jgi:hypothetical protein
MGEKKNPCSILVGKPEGKRQLGRPRREWENNIKTDISMVESNEVDISGSEYRPVVGHYEHGDGLSGSINGGEISVEVVSFVRRALLHAVI